jgi:hypothetical protein
VEALPTRYAERKLSSAGARIYIDKLCGCEAWRDPAGDHAASACR